MQLTKSQLNSIECLRRKDFKPEEFFFSETSNIHQIVNFPDDLSVIDNLMLIADKAQLFRDILKFPIKINSAYRCLKVNRIIGSEDSSQHIKGQALDFTCAKYGTPEKIFNLLMKAKIETDQCLMEGSWIHYSIKSSDNRNIYAKLINGVFTKI